MLFFQDYDKPGPGVHPDEPRKEGVRRFGEVLGRDMWRFFKAGFLLILSAVPMLCVVYVGVMERAVGIMLLGGIVGGAIMGPQLTGLSDTILRSLRDEPGFWWHLYRRAWKRNAAASVLPGAVAGAMVSAQAFTIFNIEKLRFSLPLMLVYIVSIFISWGITIYIWPQIAVMELPFLRLIKNSFLLFLRFLPRSLGAAAACVAYAILMFLFFPLSSPLIVFLNFWFPMSIALLAIYKPFEKAFDLEASIKKVQEAKESDEASDGEETTDTEQQ